MPPQRRHEVLTETFDLLEPGEGFVLVNDHDPKPLYYELRSTHGDVIGWEDREENPAAWKTAIEKTSAAEGTDDPSATDASADGVAASFDVREIPKPERHPTIHHRYGNVPAGATLEIVAPHEPVPLRREFEARYGDAFSWDVRGQEPGRCRVHVTKEESAESGNSGDSADRGADTATNQDAAASTDADDLTVAHELDVRDRPPAERHERIYESYDDLDAGEAFVLVNDHDPKPLYHQFDAEAGDEFRWEYRQKDPGEFRVLIGKAASTSDAEATGTADPEAPF